MGKRSGQVGGGGQGPRPQLPPDSFRSQMGKREKHLEKKSHKEINRKVHRKVEKSMSHNRGYIGLIILLLSLILVFINLCLYFGLKHKNPQIEGFVSWAEESYQQYLAPLFHSDPKPH